VRCSCLVGDTATRIALMVRLTTLGSAPNNHVNDWMVLSAPLTPIRIVDTTERVVRLHQL